MAGSIRGKCSLLSNSPPHKLVLILLVLLMGVPASRSTGDNDGQCDSETVLRHRPFPSTSAVVSPITSMDVRWTATDHPFWMALPSSSSNPGYLSDSARATSLMNPSGSAIIHELLGGPNGCSKLHPETGLPPLVVDVGAHIGWFSMFSASYGCRVVSFEPQPHAHPFLNATITLNGWQDRVRVYHAAVSDDSSQRMKMVNRHGWGNWDITEMAPLSDPDPGDEVPVLRVDDVVDEDILLFKIDAEGAEDLVVKSAARILESKRVDMFLIESKKVDDEARDTFKKDFFQSLVDTGYHAYEFYEEVGRLVYSWNLQDHLLPIQELKSFEGWPADQEYEDHVFSITPLPLPQDPVVSINFPPRGHAFRNPSSASISISTFNFSIPKDGFLRIWVNDKLASEVNTAETGASLGRNLRQMALILPELSQGDYAIEVRLFDVHGEPMDHLGAEDGVTFRVDHAAAPMETALTWHCGRFLSPDRCV